MKMQAIQETSPMESQTLVAVVQHQNGTSPRKTPFQNGNQQEHLIHHCFVPPRLCVNHLGNTCFMNGVANSSPIQQYIWKSDIVLN
ncbi:Uncharacterized protein APZ42_029062 [Daphnia magna]|uniref:Uncharacterized protein n=1 Tax=Daphnia magna TaxID=35525 RepID=A0A164PYH8_9CRUS|nr:Uncharacterized protein APZ42_029062 [Daphnia magna]